MDDMEKYYTILPKEEFRRINTAFHNLVEYDSRIYDLTTNTMYRLERTRMQKSAKYEQCLQTLKLLKLKEQRILENIGSYIDIEDFTSYIESFIYQETNDEAKRKMIMRRIMNMVSEMTLESDEFLEEEDIATMKRGIEYLNDLHINFIKKIGNRSAKTPRLIQYKYHLAFTNPKLETDLMFAGFQPKDLIRTSIKDKIKSLNIDLDSYEVEKEEVYYEYFLDILNEIVTESQENNSDKIQNQIAKFLNDHVIKSQENNFDNILNEITNTLNNIRESQKDNFDKNKIKNQLNLLSFMAKKMPTIDLVIIHHELISDLENDSTGILYQDVSVLECLLDLIQKELTKRDDYDNTQSFNQLMFGSEEQGEIEYIDALPEEQVSNIFELINQVTTTYNIGMKLSFLETLDKKDTTEFKKNIDFLRNSAEKEKEIAKKIIATQPANEIIIDVLDNCLNLIAGVSPGHTIDHLCSAEALDNRNEVIMQRIINLLPELYTVNDNVYRSSNVPRFILQAHLLEVLSRFEQVINENQEDKPYLITTKYEEIIANDDLTEDFINAEGNMENLVLLDDETLASILGIELDEYKFDKSELLHNYVSLTIESIFESPQAEITDLEHARLIFKSVYIDTALENIEDRFLETSSQENNQEKTYQKTK